MATRGRPPKPKAEHELHGTRRRDRHGEPADVPEPEGQAEMPAHLGKHAKELWKFVLVDLAKANVVRRIDSIALGECCQWYQRYRECASALDHTDVTDEDAYKLTIQTGLCWKNFEAMAVQFGLTPVARMRVRVEPSRKPTIAARQRSTGKK